MLRRGNRQRQQITDGFVESGVGTSPVLDRLVLVLQIVLDVSQFMVDNEELVHIDPSALLDPDVIRGEKVPSAGVANQVTAIGWLFQDALVPEVPADMKQIFRETSSKKRGKRTVEVWSY